jgi:hypothetical protein
MAVFTQTQELGRQGEQVDFKFGKNQKLLSLMGVKADGTQNWWGKTKNFLPIPTGLANRMHAGLAGEGSDTKKVLQATQDERLATGGAKLGFIANVIKTILAGGGGGGGDGEGVAEGADVATDTANMAKLGDYSSSDWSKMGSSGAPGEANEMSKLDGQLFKMGIDINSEEGKAKRTKLMETLGLSKDKLKDEASKLADEMAEKDYNEWQKRMESEGYTVNGKQALDDSGNVMFEFSEKGVVGGGKAFVSSALGGLVGSGQQYLAMAGDISKAGDAKAKELKSQTNLDTFNYL